VSGRVCPVPGCGAPAKNGHLMCRTCWDCVPRFMRASVNTRWKHFRKGGFGLQRKRADYEAACAAAIKVSEERR
jgi:hypothetical protein